MITQVVCFLLGFLVSLLWAETSHLRRRRKPYSGVYMLYVPDSWMYDFEIVSFHESYVAAYKARERYNRPRIGPTGAVTSKDAIVRFFKLEP